MLLCPKKMHTRCSSFHRKLFPISCWSFRWQWWTGTGLDSVVSELFTFFRPLAQFSTSLHILPTSISSIYIYTYTSSISISIYIYIHHLYLYIHILSRYHIYGCYFFSSITTLHKTLYVIVFFCGDIALPFISLYLVGGLEHVLFFHILEIIIPTDFHILKDGYCTTNQKLYQVGYANFLT